MNTLTKRQTEVLSFVQQFINSNRYSPSLSEIQTHFGFASVNAAAKHLASLKRKGVLAADPRRRRSISLPSSMPVESLSKSIPLPLIGTICGGEPIETFAKIETVDVPLSMVPNPEQTYVLKVLDTSLNEEMLLAGDLLIVEARTEPLPGETVVAIVNHHDTFVARYFTDGDYVKLMSHTSQHQPIVLRPKDLSIKGIVVASLRNYQ